MVDYVTVPDLPGVPAVQRDPNAIFASVAPMIADTAALSASSQATLWGIFLDGNDVIVAENVASFEFKKDSNISDYPQEDGAFSSYNKVKVPYDVRLRYTAGYSEVTRKALLDSIADIADDYILYTAVTPEASYENVNVVHYDYRRTSEKGVGLLQVDVYLRQVRPTVVAEFSNVAAPSGANPVNGGQVQTVPVDNVSFIASILGKNVSLASFKTWLGSSGSK